MDWSQIEATAITAAVSLLAAALLSMTQLAFDWLKGKTQQIKDTNVRNALVAAEADAESTVTRLVQSANQTMVDGLKKENGGKLSPSDANRIKQEVLANVQDQLAPDTSLILNDLKGGLAPYLEHLLEATVAKQKKGSSAAAL